MGDFIEWLISMNEPISSRVQNLYASEEYCKDSLADKNLSEPRRR